MSLLTGIEKIGMPALRKAVRSTEPIALQAQTRMQASRNFLRFVRKIMPEAVAEKDKNILDAIERYGLQKGEIKSIFSKPGEYEKFLLFADEKLTDGMLKRKDILPEIFVSLNKENKKGVIKLLNDSNITDEQFKDIAHLITDENAFVLKKLLKDKDFDSKILRHLDTFMLNKNNVKVLKAISKKGDISTQEMIYIMGMTDKSNSDIALRLLERMNGNTGSIQPILTKVRVFDKMTPEQIKTVNLRKKLLNDLLDCPEFRLLDESGNYKLSKRLEEVTPENYDSVKKHILEEYKNNARKLYERAGKEKHTAKELKKPQEKANVNGKAFNYAKPESELKLPKCEFKLYGSAEKAAEQQQSKANALRKLPVLGEVRITNCDGLDKKVQENILNEIEQAYEKYGIRPYRDLERFVSGANDLFITIADKDRNLIYKFDKTTGKLITISKNDKAVNATKDMKVTDIVDSEVKGGIKDKEPTPYRVETSIQSKNGKYKTLYTESDIKGQYEIYHTKPDGSITRTGHGQVTLNGAKHIRRTLTSSNGTRNYFAYREDKAGNSYLHSIIKTGKPLSEVKRTFKVISKNHFISTKNGQSYDIVFTNKNVVITKLDFHGRKTSETVRYSITDVPVKKANEISEKLKNADGKDAVEQLLKQYGVEPHSVDKSCVEMLKRLPGDEWFAMSKSCGYVLPQSVQSNNAFYANYCIFMSDELKHNLGIFSHELGHAKINAMDLMKDEELMKIYETEKKAFTSRYPESRIKSVDYFLSDRGLDEAGAETNLITNTIQTADALQDRTIFLEQFFPETIAYIREKFSAFI